MKKIINKFLVLTVIAQIAFSSTGIAFAQSMDDFGGAFGDDSVVSGGYDGFGFTNYDPYTPVTQNDFSGAYFDNASTYYGTTNCVGCDTANYSNTSYDGFGFTNYDPYTPVTQNDFSGAYFDNASTYYGTTNCVGCDTGYSYDSGYTYNPGYSYDSGYSYNPGYSYSTPSYAGYTYGTNYGYTNYTYTQPVINNTTVTTLYSCNGVVSHTPCAPVIPACPSGYTRNASGVCVPPVTPVQQCIRPQIFDPNVVRYVENYPTCSKVCTNGQTVPATGTCTNVVVNTNCSDGLPPVNGSCVRTTVIPTVNNTICSDGQYPVNGSCVRTVVQPTLAYQTCWNGNTFPLNSQCPDQYRICANGTSIPVNQTCYVGNTYVPYVPPVTIKFNNVITSVATEITLSSARCNGIGLIASGAQSTGWFEYGETSNLGRETAKANIGSSATAPFSNVLANLKPTTTYYCRAVMQNQYGVVKGEIVAFTTKAKAVSYVKPVVTTTKTVTKTKTTPSKTNQVLCVDGTYVTVDSKSSADMINAGQKLVSLQIEKTSGNLSVGSSVSYKLTLKNLSDETLKGVTVKVTIPMQITLTNASVGQYDPVTHVLTLPNIGLAAYGETSVTWTGTVNAGTATGTSMVTTAYTNYEVPGSDVQDEVTAYVVGSVIASNGNGTSTDAGAKHVIGGTSDRGFLPDSLVEWLALIAILFIIFILGRSVYTSYSSDKKAAH